MCTYRCTLGGVGLCVDTHLYSVQDGFTALHAAALEGHLRVVEMLLEANADISIMTKVITCYAGPTTPAYISIVNQSVRSGFIYSFKANTSYSSVTELTSISSCLLHVIVH